MLIPPLPRLAAVGAGDAMMGVAGAGEGPREELTDFGPAVVVVVVWGVLTSVGVVLGSLVTLLLT